MSFDLDPSVDLSRAREITLGGETLKIAPLLLRKIIASTLMLPQLIAADTPDKRIELMIDFVMLGLARTYPALRRDDLLDSEATPAELSDAVDVVILQSGRKKVDAVGEALAASPTTKPIGTSSSPNSAST
jgi:hypothetical protein